MRIHSFAPGSRSRGLLAAVLAGLLGSAAPTAALAADLASGSQIYQTRCVGCHGMGGRAVNPNAPNFIAGERLTQPDMVLMMSIKTGKTKCPPFFGVLSDKQLLDAIAFIRTFPSQPAQPAMPR
jgi:cytochrome c6